MTSTVFKFAKTVYLSDTNAEGNVYFSRYFEWHGQAREAFLVSCIPNIMEIIKSSGMVMLTCEAHNSYFKSAYLFDELSIYITIQNLKHASFDLVFETKNAKTNELISKGWQKIAFGNGVGKIIPVPDIIKQHALNYVDENN
ncbi:MAG: acyl-CoA thioesterase [Endomicrobiales bacterium]